MTLDVYKVTTKFPKDELFGLTSQMRRSAVSIGANIAEGCGRKSKHELGRFIADSMGSACELEYHLLLSRDLNLIDVETHQQLESNVVEIKRMLASYMLQLKADG